MVMSAHFQHGLADGHGAGRECRMRTLMVSAARRGESKDRMARPARARQTACKDFSRRLFFMDFLIAEEGRAEAFSEKRIIPED